MAIFDVQRLSVTDIPNEIASENRYVIKDCFEEIT